MRRIIAILLSATLAFSTCACGATPKDDNTSDGISIDKTEANEVTAVQEEAQEAAQETGNAEESTAEENEMNDDMEALSAIGDVEVENGLLTVSVTVPAEIVGDVTQEQLDENKGDTYMSAALNEDGSVTYKMTKEQHKKMLLSVSQSIDESIQKIIDEDNGISDVKHNDDFTVFDITIEGEEIGLMASMCAITFYVYGSMYDTFNGHKAENVFVNFYDSNGNFLDSGDAKSWKERNSQ